MAPPARIERVLTFSGVSFTWGSMILVAARSAVVISALRIVDHLFPLKTFARCMFGEALCCCKCATRRQMADTAHARECPVAVCPIDSPLTPSFCVVKRRIMNVVEVQVEGGAVVAWVGWIPTKNWMSRRVKGVETVSVKPAQYSPGWRRKKKAIQARSVIDLPLGELHWVIEYMQWRMETGRGDTLPGGGLLFCRSQTVVPGKN